MGLPFCQFFFITAGKLDVFFYREDVIFESMDVNVGFFLKNLLFAEMNMKLVSVYHLVPDDNIRR